MRAQRASLGRRDPVGRRTSARSAGRVADFPSRTLVASPAHAARKPRARGQVILARMDHSESSRAALAKVSAQEPIDLVLGSLAIAREEYPELDDQHYV